VNVTAEASKRKNIAAKKKSRNLTIKTKILDFTEKSKG